MEDEETSVDFRGFLLGVYTLLIEPSPDLQQCLAKDFDDHYHTNKIRLYMVG